MLRGTHDLEALRERRQFIKENPKEEEESNIVQVKSNTWYGNYIHAELTVANVSKDVMTQKRFYQEFLTKSKPVLVYDGCKDWEALKSWNQKANVSALEQEVAQWHKEHAATHHHHEHRHGGAAAHLARHSSKQKHHSEGRHARRPKSAKPEAEKERPGHDHDDDEDEDDEEDDEPSLLSRIGLEGYDFYNAEGMEYFQNLWITWNDDLKKYYEIPEFIFDTLHLHDIYLSFYGEESNENQKTHAKE